MARARGDAIVAGEPGLPTVGAHKDASPGIGDVHDVGVVGPHAHVVAQASQRPARPNPGEARIRRGSRCRRRAVDEDVIYIGGRIIERLESKRASQEWVWIAVFPLHVAVYQELQVPALPHNFDLMPDSQGMGGVAARQPILEGIGPVLFVQARPLLRESYEVTPDVVETVDQVDTLLQHLELKLDSKIAGVAATGPGPLMSFTGQHPVLSVLDDSPARL